MNIPTAPMESGQVLKGKVSWFGGPHDAETGNNRTATGTSSGAPGIAIYNRATLGGYWRVRAANGKVAILKQTDLGPAPFTGRKIDVSSGALGKLGYSEGDFPTNAEFTATFLGHTLPAGGQIEPATTMAPQPAAAAPSVLDTKGLAQAQQKAEVNRFLVKEIGGGADNPLRLVLPTSEPNPASFETTKAAPAPAVPGVQAGGNAAGYVNPLPSGFTQGRTDMGVDFSAAPGAAIHAIGNAKILGITPNWYHGQPYVSYELLDGPAKGKVVYVAEQITPHVTAGQHVAAGAVIGTYAPSGTGIEMGFGHPGGQTLAQATTGYTEGQVTRAGQEFAGFLARLGHSGGQQASHPHAVVAPASGTVVAGYHRPAGPRAIVHYDTGRTQHVASPLPVGHKFIAGSILGAPATGGL